MWKLFFLVSVFALAKSEVNETKNVENEVKVELKEESEAKAKINTEQANIPPPPSTGGAQTFLLPTEEMDRLLACSYILSKDLDNDKIIINRTAIRLNVTEQMLLTKISYSKLLICAQRIDNKTANLFFKDLVFLGERDTKKYSNLTYIDYKSMDANYSIELTNEESFNAYKFEKARTKFEEKRNDMYKINKKKITVLGYDIFDSQIFKTLFFLISLCALTFGLLYLLSKVMKKPKAPKNKKKKRN